MIASRIVVVATGALAGMVLHPAAADTLNGALVQAYANNPQLGAQRAATRATDENVPIQLGGYRPRLTATDSINEAYLDQLSRTTVGRVTTGYSRTTGENLVTSLGVTATQTLFNGFQTGNRTRQAEAQVLASRETLRTTEQTVLLSAATAYMNLLRDTAILDLNRSNVTVLEATLRQTRDNLAAGIVTRTDVAQSESSLALGRANLEAAESNYTTSRAQYRQVIGVEPGRLAPGTPVDRFFPRTEAAAVGRGLTENPAITTASYNVDTAELQVKIAEGALYPVVTATASVTKQFGSTTNLNNLQSLTGIFGAQVAIPLYQGGSEFATIRQAKETLGQQRMNLETARDQVRSNVVQTWGQLDAAKAQIEATQAQVAAAEIALAGVREEARAGQRTTLDVLNAQQTLLQARVALVTAQHDRIVASFAVLSAVGGLSPQVLGLPIENYDPVVHYRQVRDAWGGVRTPDGR
ncbi:MAG TPA: TolC family outer membrane protein [Xanthobacteraceae bacterium]|jgi:outer membrane protein